MPIPKNPYIIPIFIPFLGCPFTCLYCQQEKITDTESELPTPTEVTERIAAFLKTRRSQKYSHTEVAFYGGTFTGLSASVRVALLKAAYSFLKRGEVRNLRASTKPDFVSQEVLEEITSYGLDTLELGVQSMEDGVLRKVGRGYGSEEVKRAVALLKSKGMKVGMQLMPGLPGAGPSEALQTVEATLKLKPDFVRIYPTVVLRGTPLERMYRQGQYRPWELEEAIQVCRKIKRRFGKAGIPIIKMGLEFTSDEREGIVAGPYHPLFHRLV